MNPFEIPGPQLRRMGETRPVPGEAAVLGGWLHSRRLVLLKTLLTRAERTQLPPQTARALREHWTLLEDAEHHDPAAARGVLGYPAAGNWLAHALAAPGDDFVTALAGLGALAATVATAAGCDFRLVLSAHDGILALPGLGSYMTTAPRVRMEATDDTVTFTPQDGRPTALARGDLLSRAAPPAEGWRPLGPLPGGPAVLDDQDPHLARETGRAGLAGLLPAALIAPDEAYEWRELWSRALDLLGDADPERAAEVVGLVRAVVPVLWKPDGRASATRLAAPWAVLTTLPRTPEEMAEVLVHEVQHSKLAVLGGVVRLNDESAEAVYRVGWRSDPRPLGAVVQGTYAHLALADLWARLARRASATPAERAAARRRAADYGAQVDHALFLLLGSGQLTRQGTEFVEGMRHRYRRLSSPGGRAARDAESAEHAGNTDSAGNAADSENAADRLTNGHFG
ncbi:aKG-HExxH-type peptide beta-hydroxylase [Streptomyces smyrnaeus]|uniref:aKG-HExxH-type peptide beta-hydroxylase n=1 Tax=Streptomyces TaxID=1883 RepID=UPI000C466FA7|nr:MULTISPECIES: HEXXH motif-containing putative peptide modification protein [unclassified Streptomyces]